MHNIDAPVITVIAAVDENLNTVYGKRPIGWHPDVSASTRSLDQAIMRHNIRATVADYMAPDASRVTAMAVMGETCFSELWDAKDYKGTLDAAVQYILVTGKTAMTLYSITSNKITRLNAWTRSDNESAADWTIERACTIALDRNIDQVLVLGGRTVYNTFIPYAQNIFLNYFRGIQGGEKPLSIPDRKFQIEKKSFGKLDVVTYHAHQGEIQNA